MSGEPRRRPRRDCRTAALAFLGRRAHPRRELERKLLRGGHEAAEVARTLDALAAAGLLDEAETAAELARFEAGRGRGSRRVSASLRSRGVAEADAARALAGLGGESEAARLAAALEKKARSLPGGLTPVSRSRKLFDHLVRRGFDPAAVREALREKGDPTDDDSL
ncbi:MAG TPA: RecX family transcriptional regulator [Thermoanaerobaculia bacterium]|nr:RecX family transcriptional regulator [Thermoanaerobaculia bacterium]